jgi:hypothetical protein
MLESLTLLDSSMLRHALLTISHPIFGRHPLPRPRQANPVASDAVSFEVYPALNPEFDLHHHLLAGWGVPIGEP